MQEKKTEKLFYVACSTHDGALRVRQICGVGCIACGICEKLSQEGFFKVENNLSHADYTKQTPENVEQVKTLADKCPTKVIKEI
jgi:electron transport complex protein RnfB